MISLSEIKNVKYPNPYLRRDNFISLDGEWECSFSNSNKIPSIFDLKIIVPFPVETNLSGVNDNQVHESIWYRKKIKLDITNKKVIINFLGSDYETILFINGKRVGSHKGCYTDFSFDITKFILDGENEIVVHVKDSFAKDQLRGKQRTRNENYDCWYVQTSGICRSVYIEMVDATYIKNIRILTKNNGKITINLNVNNGVYNFDAKITQNGKNVCKFHINSKKTIIQINGPLLWDIDNPNLYDLEINTGSITTSTSFGFRQISNKKTHIYINNKRTYLRMILDQGYWKDSFTTPPSLDALYEDIKLIKEMGFNGIRKHQKIEDYRFYYLCDVLGMYVWGEIPSGYEFTDRMQKEMLHDIPLIQKSLFNSPSIIVWLLFNESWGICGIHNNPVISNFVKKTYVTTKKNKGNRLIITNDGWNQTNETDILSLHEYEQNGNTIKEKYKDFNKLLTYTDINHYGPAFNVFSKYNKQPVMFSEFGGVSCSKDGWGYGEKATQETFICRIKDVFKAIYSLKYLSGFCYTQLTDVQQETNGLLTIERKPKISIDIISKIVKGGK